MSTKYYRVSELDKVVMDEVNAFAWMTVENMEAAAVEAATWAKNELRAKSPKNTGDYSKEWRIDKKRTRTGNNTTVYNKGLYMLSHLLEYGHPTGNGGRTKDYHFIGPINNEALDKFEEALRRRIENGS